MSIYYKYAPDGTHIVVLYYIDDCVSWCTSEALGKWFVDNLGKILCELLGIFTLVHVNQYFSDEESFHSCG